MLLLDEPIAHLDARLRYETRAELKQLHRRIGTTTVHVTHDQQEALAVADLIAVIQDGVLQQLGAPLELYDTPRNAFVAGFIGDPPMSLLVGSLSSESGAPALRVGENTVSVPPALASSAASARSGKLLVGLRPAQLRIADSADDDVLPAMVYSHESVGRQTELMLVVGESRLRYRGSLAGRTVRAGETLHIGLSLAGSKLFDAGTGEALS